ncbi:MAG TPA: hypothetical protein VF719_12550, partial [Abditibacteriaceae bacterium]
FAEGQLFRWQSGSVGVANYGRVLVVRVAPAGLYLACIFPFRLMHPPLLIPWNEVKAVRRKRIFFRRTTWLTIGSPKLVTVVLENPKIAEAAESWLPPAV